VQTSKVGGWVMLKAKNLQLTRPNRKLAEVGTAIRSGSYHRRLGETSLQVATPTDTTSGFPRLPPRGVSPARRGSHTPGPIPVDGTPEWEVDSVRKVFRQWKTHG
jgi:hypothetical protein